jgi:hypothetical protein
MSVLDQLLDHLEPDERNLVVKRGTASLVMENGLGMQAVAIESDGGLIEVHYERAPDETARERCTPEVAARLLGAIMARSQLEPVALPAPTPGSR